MKKFFKWIGRLINGMGAEFREGPLKFSIAIAILGLVVFMFIGGLNIKAKHGDTTIEVTTEK